MHPIKRKEYLWLHNVQKSQVPWELCLHCPKGEVLLPQRDTKESGRVNAPLQSSHSPVPETPIYLRWPQVRELARTTIGIHPQRAKAGGGTAVGPHCSRVLAAHEEGQKAWAKPCQSCLAQHSSHRLSSFRLRSTFCPVSSPLCQCSAEHGGNITSEICDSPLFSSCNTCQRVPPSSSQMCAESWHRGSKAAKFGAPFIPWLGLGMSRAGLVERDCESFLAPWIKSVSIPSCILHWGRRPEISDRWWMSCLTPGKRAGPFP